MNTITGIRELDAYLVTFMDQNTIYNYSVLSKDTNQLISGHRLFDLLKEYHEAHFSNENILTWAIRKDIPYILDWYMNFGHKFVNVFPLVDLAIISSSTKILDWFYQRGMFDYTLDSLQYIILNGLIDILDWFYDHGLEIPYLDKLLCTPEFINNYHSHGKLLKILKWLHQKNYPIIFNFGRLKRTITADSVDLINWLLEHQLIDRSVFVNGQPDFSFELSNLPVEKQLEVLTFTKEIGCYFGYANIYLLLNHPIEILEWSVKNIPQITLADIFRVAAPHNRISVIEWTGINKNHPIFSSIDNKYIYKQALNRYDIDVLIWYCNNTFDNTPHLTDLYNILSSLDNLTLEKITALEKLFSQPYLIKSSVCLHPLELIHQKLIKPAFRAENIPVLEYLEFKLSVKAIEHIYVEDILHCISHGYIKSLNWLEKYLGENIDPAKIPIVIKFINDCSFSHEIDVAASHNELATIKWVKRFFPNKFEFKCAIDNAASRWNVDVFNWFVEMFGDTPTFNYSNMAIDGSIFFGKLQPLKWFYRSRHQFVYSTNAIDDSIHNNYVHFLRWFKENECPMVFTMRSIYLACDTYTCETLQWLKDNGVITILDREVRGDLLVFKIELAQPFAHYRKSNITFITIAQNFHDTYFVNIVPLDNDQTIYTVGINGDKQLLEIMFKQKELVNCFTTNPAMHLGKTHMGGQMYYSQPTNIYHSLCWFERCYKNQKN